MLQQRREVRYGIAELFGYQIDRLTVEERNSLLTCALNKAAKEYPKCPFRLPDKKGEQRCTKRGGVCSIRKYLNSNGMAEKISGFEGKLTVTCPLRFYQDKEVFRWIGEMILGTNDLILTREVPFLESLKGFELADTKKEEEENVGRIDLILIDRQTLNSTFLRWCAVEVQAVYFSGDKMENEFRSLLQHEQAELPFPKTRRRPDYRSSAPKRLMPQLQIKVPAIRRWGKKMAVVVDAHFFEWMGQMEDANDISNCDIVWFVVDFDEEQDKIAKLKRGKVVCTTLERAINGLTGGIPTSMSNFERVVLEKIQRGEFDECYER